MIVLICIIKSTSLSFLLGTVRRLKLFSLSPVGNIRKSTSILSRWKPACFLSRTSSPCNSWKRYFKNHLHGCVAHLSKNVDILNVTYDIAQEERKQYQWSIVTENLQPCAQLFYTQIRSKTELPSSFLLPHPVLKKIRKPLKKAFYSAKKKSATEYYFNWTSYNLSGE